MSEIGTFTEQGTRKLQVAVPTYEAEAAKLSANLAMILFIEWVSHGRDGAPLYDAVSDALRTAGETGDLVDNDDVWSAINALEERAFFVGFEAARRFFAGGAR